MSYFVGGFLLGLFVAMIIATIMSWVFNDSKYGKELKKYAVPIRLDYIIHAENREKATELALKEFKERVKNW